MKFGKAVLRAMSLSVPAWADKWMDYKLLKRLIYSIPAYNETNGIVIDDKSAVSINELINLSGAEAVFFHQLKQEVRKCAVHFAIAEAELAEKYEQMISSFQAFCAKYAGAEQMSADRATDARNLLVVIVRLTSALIQLENYAVMNFCGFGKALKKHDKVTGTTTKVQFMQSCVNVQSFANYPILLKMLSGTEEAWRFLVAIQPSAALHGVDITEARQLQDLRRVKAVSSIQKAKFTA